MKQAHAVIPPKKTTPSIVGPIVNSPDVAAARVHVLSVGCHPSRL